ncbi:MAG: hypothetical protein IPK19_22440 [Chloroflexi bacterium]|nr:hypothetical protein [Chloroflexota bacterium]
MTTREQEIIEKFHDLEPDAKQRVLQSLQLDIQASFDYAGWWARVDSLQADLRDRLGNDATTDALTLLDELREEEP